MAEITVHKDKARDLTSIVIVGTVFLEEVMEVIQDFYESDFTRHLLWDVRHGSLEVLTRDQEARIIALAKRYAHQRKDGKTVIVAPGDLNFGLSRMYKSLCEVKEHPVQHAVFKTIEEALHWIEVPHNPDTE